ncbi:hypothetical protein PGTUg99_032874 [Puccinia graminis f. sp. tritici]|uniref:Uncharacterized protein n=1 Tax=Puccinia graminis f. sp. tritici TaxID=56615 RepID=A0A5B0NJY8_PUCGR|nr:hypothetical protein PGTUg99_032874 [Puccinia graminis f. sp. tritici]
MCMVRPKPAGRSRSSTIESNKRTIRFVSAKSTTLSPPSKPTASSLSKPRHPLLASRYPSKNLWVRLSKKCQCRRYPSSSLSPRRRYPLVVATPS